MKTNRSLLLVLWMMHVPFSTHAEFMPAMAVPLERMEAHIQAHLKETPEDPEWIYRMGRVQYLAFDFGVAASPTLSPDKPGDTIPTRAFVYFSPEALVQRAEASRRALEESHQSFGDFYQAYNRHLEEVSGEGWERLRLTAAERVERAAKAERLLSRARELDPDNALYALTQGSLRMAWLEKPELHADDNPPELKSILPETAMRAFESAWRLARSEDLKREHLPIEGPQGLVSAEAAKAWLELADASGKGDADIAKRMRRDLRKVDKLKYGLITPLMFTLSPNGNRVPVDASARVAFDLAGDGRGGIWAWPREGAALLVWDPLGQGDIRSGSQLFGAYTWQMFWKNGFEPLALMDLDRDGMVSGGELAGLAAWFDREPLGVSSPGEVVPLLELGVLSLGLEARSFRGRDALVWHPTGVTFVDGRSVPLWDWLAQPAE